MLGSVGESCDMARHPTHARSTVVAAVPRQARDPCRCSPGIVGGLPLSRINGTGDEHDLASRLDEASGGTGGWPNWVLAWTRVFNQAISLGLDVTYAGVIAD